MGVIYKITNLINGKIYIGQTKVTEPQRWQGHIWNAYNDPKNDSPHLCYAIIKYGKNNFKREILEECNSTEELNNKEIYYIKKYNSTNPDIGYNISLGGGGHTKFSDEEILTLYLEYKSITKVANILNADKNAISRRLHGIGVETYNTTIDQYSRDGIFVNSYSSFASARRESGLLLPSIIPKHHCCCNYFWIYETEDLTIEEVIQAYKNNNQITKKIKQYDLNCNFIKEFNSAAEASRELNINLSSIKAALNNRQFTAGGFIWYKENGSKYSLEEVYNRYLLSPSCCQIEEVDINNNVIGRYESATKFEKEMNWSYNSIKRVCDGERTHTHGRIFRYANKDKRKLINEREG